MLRRTTAAALAATLAAGVLTVVTSSPPAQAALAADFDPGNIISDQVFFDSSAMTVAEVDHLLDLKGASCVAGEQACLKDYVSTTVARNAEPGLCAGYAGGQQQTAAQMIVGVAQSCGVNPRVLLVLLEKEQSLVSRARPTTRAYQAATGYGCPDTAPCDSQYYGLFNQLYQAARQYQRYAANPNSYSYRAGRTNTIYWHPNASCGTSQVYIVNQATAGLYNYTPYRPNAAALASLYGTGDSCSSYGNRNFWRIFTDWFGSTQSSSALLRSQSDASVYLVSGDTKYPIGSMALVADLAPAGPVAFVSQQYLDRRTTGPAVQHTLHGPDGSIYLVDNGVLYPFGSCGMVGAYGMSCGELVSVADHIIAEFRTGPLLLASIRTTSGKTFQIEGGTRREAADDESLAAAGYPTSGVTLPESAIDYLPYGDPIVRPGLLLMPRAGGGTGALVTETGAVAVPDALRAVPGLETILAPLDAGSLQRVTTSGQLGVLVRDSRDGTLLFLTDAGKVQVSDAATAAGSTLAAPAAFLDAIPAAGTTTTLFVRSHTQSTVYVVRGGERHPIRSWADLVQLAGSDQPEIRWVAQPIVDSLPLGEPYDAPGSLVRTASNATVFLTDGPDRLVAVSTFLVTGELGAWSLHLVSDEAVARRTVAPGILGIRVQCGSMQFVGVSGALLAVRPTEAAHFAGPTTTLAAETCDSLPRSSRAIERFLRVANGTIFLITDGVKQPIRSYGRYVSLGGTAANTIQVSDFVASQFPTGTLL